jgi:D-tagatose-1,6-bisphosphate aldolase subunit GatZ/KbaZ
MRIDRNKIQAKNLFSEIVRNQKLGIPEGICSICSSNLYVIETAIEKSLTDKTHILIESTSNQVNQFGGYTQMNPEMFRDFVLSIGRKIGLPSEKIIFGGDHLGPFPWRNEKVDSAMGKACEMVSQYVKAGFAKIHLDASMPLADDPAGRPLDVQTISERGAALCLVAEKAFKETGGSGLFNGPPVYVIGTEVVTPGGSQEIRENIRVTEVSDLEETIKSYRETFLKYKLEEAWDRVLAVVVQPGVEFEQYKIHDYNSENAKDLCNALKRYPNLIFEGHSTDYQKKSALRQMVKDGIAILKVGPALTYAVREALFALNYIENELFESNSDMDLSHFKDVLESVMVRNPINWASHYHGDEPNLKFDRKYSLFDRCRYYLTDSKVQNSINLLIKNLRSGDIPLTLISQFLPLQYEKIKNGCLKNDPVSLIKDKVAYVLDNYSYAFSNLK